jgi:hypothetical protein
MDWVYLSQSWDRWWAHVNTVMNFQVPQNAGNFLGSWTSISFFKEGKALWGQSVEVSTDTYW